MNSSGRAILLVAFSAAAAMAASRPNVVLIMTDDQGYGDLACHGNPVLKTPNIDRLATEGMELTNFHVDPTCTPTRAALMTGRFATRTGCVATTSGFSLLPRDEVTMAEAFQAGGYATGMFGKWHLGDNYPFRPQDRGFAEVVKLGGGGVTQSPDFWGNNYWDDAYEHNGVWQRYTGFCTDVFFDEAIRFVRENRDRPFFCYLTPNAPHAPYNASDEMIRGLLAQGVPPGTAHFYAMVENIDTNVGRMMRVLDELGLAENTILIFTTDNGSAMGDGARAAKAGWKGYNAGLRGTKGSLYEGGHRVPFMIRWPHGGLAGGRKVDQLAAHIDLLPTFLRWCNLERRAGPPLDGLDLSPAIRHAQPIDRRLYLSLGYEKNRRLVMTPEWRLLSESGRDAPQWKLYRPGHDRGQQSDLAGQHPGVVRELIQASDRWYADTTSRLGAFQPIVLGNPAANPAHLSAHDWRPLSAPGKGGPNPVPWNQTEVAQANPVNGYWHVEVERAGRYAITLRQQPAVAKKPIDGVSARLKIATVDVTQPIPQRWVDAWNNKYTNAASSVTFDVTLPAGRSTLQTGITDEQGRERGAFFVEVRRLDSL